MMRMMFSVTRMADLLLFQDESGMKQSFVTGWKYNANKGKSINGMSEVSMRQNLCT